MGTSKIITTVPLPRRACAHARRRSLRARAPQRAVHRELTPKEPKIHTGCNHRAWHACKPGQMHISPSASPMTHHMLSQQHRLQSSKSYISLAPFGRNAPLPPAPGARRRASCSRREHSVSGPSASTAPRTHRPRAAIGDLTHHRRHASFMIPDAHLTSFTSPPPSLPTAALLPHTCRTRAAHLPHSVLAAQRSLRRVPHIVIGPNPNPAPRSSLQICDEDA